jgi:hypothetical protein
MNVPRIDSGSAREGMIVDEILRKKRKMTSTTRTSVRSNVNWTSSTDCLTVSDRSKRMLRFTDAGSFAWNVGSRSRTAFATSTVFVPGWRWIARMIPRWSTNQAAVLSFSTPFVTSAISSKRTGWPFR